MIAYNIITQEDCGIGLAVEGQHVAAGLDALLQAKAEGSALRVPYLAEGLILRISTLRAIDVVQAACSGGCMPGMILVALDKIKRRAMFWHRKAIAHEVKEDLELEKIRRDRLREAAQERVPDPETAVDPDPCEKQPGGAVKGRKRPARQKRDLAATSSRGKPST